MEHVSNDRLLTSVRDCDREAFTLVEVLVVNMFAIGVKVTPLPIGPDIRPKQCSALVAPSRAKLFTDTGANWQGIWVAATYRHRLFTAKVVPSPLHRASLNVVMADGDGACGHSGER